MPTARPRHLVTESDELAAALDAAARRHPGVSRPQLLVRLALEEHRSAQADAGERRRHRAAVVDRHAGVLTGCWTAGDRGAPDEDWLDRAWSDGAGPAGAGPDGAGPDGSGSDGAGSTLPAGGDRPR